MPWVRIDDSFHSDPAIERAGNAAAGLLVRCESYSSAYGLDGCVPHRFAKRIGTASDIAALQAEGLWRAVVAGETFTVTERRDSGNRRLRDIEVVVHEPGYYQDSFLHRNRARVEVEENRAKAARGGRGGDNTEADAQAPAQADGQANAEAISRPVPTRPVKSQTHVEGTQTLDADDVIPGDDVPGWPVEEEAPVSEDAAREDPTQAELEGLLAEIDADRRRGALAS